MPIARAKYIPRNRKELVVNPSTVKSKSSHHQDQVTNAMHVSQDFFSIRVLHQPNSKSQQNSTMTNISKHHSEEEREDGNCEKSRVYFFVPRDTIGIDYFLERGSEVVSFEVSGRTDFSGRLSHGDNMGQAELKESSFVLGDPNFCNHGTSRFIFILNHLKHVHCSIDDRFLLD